MSTRIHFTLLLLLLAIGCVAQTPQFTAGSATAGNYFPFGSIDGKGSRVQLLYKPSDFAALPASGTITRIYFKADNGTESDGLASYQDLSLRIGATVLQELPADGSSFTLSLSTVFEAAEYQARFNRGQWLAFTLQQPFVYSDTANLLLEISVARSSAMRYLGVASSTGMRRVWGKTGSDRADGSDTKLYALGIDVIPGQTVVAAAAAPGVTEEEITTTQSPHTNTHQSTIETPAPANHSLSQSPHTFTHVETEPAPVRNKGGKWFLIGTAVLAALGLGTMFPLLPRTRKLATWAVHNPKKAKGWLFGLQFLGSIAALYTGVKLFDYGITTSDASATALLAASTLATLLYPRRNRGGDIWKSYVRQKMAGGLVVASGFGLLAGVGNRCASQQDFCRPASYVITQMDSQHYERSASYQMNSDGTSKQNKGWKIAATIGAVILLIAMLVTVTVLACAVFCIIAWESSAAGIIIFGILAGGAVGALGVFGSVKLFLLFKKLIWGR